MIKLLQSNFKLVI